MPAAARRLLRLAALVPALAFLLTVIAPPFNHDVAAVLDFSGRWLGGERLYADIVDVNPPLIFVLNLLPAAIGAWTPLDAVQALLLCLLGLCALSAGLALRLLPEAPVEAACLAVGIPLLTLAAGYDFGQREHLMVLAALPYLLLAARRIEGVPTGRGLALGCAVLAGLGFAQKPHFLVVPGLVEGLVLLRRGPGRALRDPVPWTMAAVWLLYLAAIPVFFPDYFGRVLPLIWRYYLHLSNFSWWQVILTERLGTALMLLLPLAVLAFLQPGWGALPQVLALAGLGTALSAVAQHKGWTYHALPVRLLAGLLAVVLAARWLDRALPAMRALRAAPAAAVVAAFALGIHNFAGAEAPWREITWTWSRPGQLSALLERHVHGRSLLVLSPDIFPIYPAVNYAHARMTLRWMNLWLLQGVYRHCPANGARYHEIQEMPPAEAEVFRSVADDFARAPPAAVLVSRNPGIPRCGREFDFIEYFSRSPLFAGTFRRYRAAAELDGYRLFLRED